MDGHLGDSLDKKKKIVFIEDHEYVRHVVAKRLSANGYKIITAKDGQEGLDKVKAEMPDLVITDLALPKINGSVIVRILKKSPAHQRIPIIMLSAFVRESMGEHLDVAADFYMPKPFNSEDLVGKVRELIGEGDSPEIR